MATHQTLTNIADETYDRLMDAAKVHHQGLNNEVIACLEHGLMPARDGPREHLARPRGIREGTQPGPSRIRVVSNILAYL